MSEFIYKITEQFEEVVAKYTGAPYAVAVDSCTSALFLSLKYLDYKNKFIGIPNRTYMSVPCTIINSGNRVIFDRTSEDDNLTGEYQLTNTPVWDSALKFTSDMYRSGQYQCLSFSGPRKILKLSKGGMILTDNKDAYNWFKRARFSGRNEMSYHDDNFDMIGWNMYMLPELSTRGLLLMTGMPTNNIDLTLPYPDLSKFEIYTK